MLFWYLIGSLGAVGSRGDEQGMRYRFSTDSLPVAERYAYWRDVICPEFYRLTSDGCLDTTTFTARSDVRDAGRFGFAKIESSDRERARSASDIARDNAEYVTLYRAQRDGQGFDFGAAEMTLGAGDMCIVSTARRFRWHARDGQAFQTLIVPAGFLAPLLAGGALQGPLQLSGASPLGSLLAASLDVVWEQIPNISEKLGDSVLANLAGLLAVACGASEEGTAAARHGAAAMRGELILRHIDRHLADPNLTSDHAARALGISPRQVHALLEPTGETFARHVMRRRLEACRLALEDPVLSCRSITDIAFGWGFNSLATFYRAYRAAYGIAPGDHRALSAAIKPE